MAVTKEPKAELSVRDAISYAKDVEKNLTARLKTTNNDIKRVDSAIVTRAKTLLDKQITRLEKLNNLVKLDKRIVDMETRLDTIGERMRLLIHKETILTEVSRFARDKGDWMQMAQFHLAIMRAYNQEDEWWDANGHEIYIGVWFDKIMKLLEE